MDEYTIDELREQVDDIISIRAGWNPGCTTDHRVHLAILNQPYLSLVLDEKKTIESRFSRDRRAPYNRVTPGDIIILKESSGYVQGMCKVVDARFYELSPGIIEEIKRKHREQLCIADEAYWKENIEPKKFGSLLWVSNVVHVDPFKFKQRGQQAWIVVKDLPEKVKTRSREQKTLLEYTN